MLRFDLGGITGLIARASKLPMKLSRHTLIGKQRLRLDGRDERFGLVDVVHLSSRQAQHQRISQRIDDNMNFRGQSAARAADSLVEPSFLRAPALC